MHTCPRGPTPLQLYRDPRTYFSFIVGNDRYSVVSSSSGAAGQAQLTKCVTDARDVRAALVAQGYLPGNIVLLTDAIYDDMIDEFRLFVRRLDGAVGCTVVVYYAGHAVEDAGGCILLPTDANLACMWAGIRPEAPFIANRAVHTLYTSAASSLCFCGTCA
jgi:hypothetical protein